MTATEPTGQSILDAQNTPESLQDLAAQRRLYNLARFWHRAEFAFGVLLTAALVAIGALCGESAAWVAVGGIVLPLLATHIFRKLRESRQKSAACVQERFDCRVLQLAQSASHESMRVPLEDIVEASEEFKKKHPIDSVRGWYTAPIGEAPFDVGRLICQRENVHWDRKLKERAGVGCLAVTALVAVTAVVIGLAYDLSFKHFLVFVAAPTFPLSYSLLLLGLELRHSAKRLDDIRTRIEGAWDDMLKPADQPDCSAAQARQVQDDIYRNRVTTPMVPNFMYRLFREGQEMLAAKTAEQLIAEAASRRGKGPV